MLVGGSETCKTHLSVAIALSCIRLGRGIRSCTVIDLVNRLETEPRPGKTGRLAGSVIPAALSFALCPVLLCPSGSGRGRQWGWRSPLVMMALSAACNGRF